MKVINIKPIIIHLPGGELKLEEIMCRPHVHIHKWSGMIQNLLPMSLNNIFL